MTRILYYVDTAAGSADLFEHPADMVYHDFAPAPGMPRGTYVARKSSARFVAGKGWLYDWTRASRRVEFKSNPSRHQCNAKCQSARGQICECSCDGRNHGRFGLGRQDRAAPSMPLFAEAV